MARSSGAEVTSNHLANFIGIFFFGCIFYRSIKNTKTDGTHPADWLAYPVILRPQTVGKRHLECLGICVRKQTSLTTQGLLETEKDREKQDGCNANQSCYDH